MSRSAAFRHAWVPAFRRHGTRGEDDGDDDELKAERKERRALDRQPDYPIPNYRYMRSIIQRYRRQRRLDLVFEDAQKRQLFVAQPSDFPALHELLGTDLQGNDRRAVQPWIVVLPMAQTRLDPTIDFPYSTSPDGPWLAVKQLSTGTQFQLYCEDQDFRIKRAVGVALVNRITLA